MSQSVVSKWGLLFYRFETKHNCIFEYNIKRVILITHSNVSEMSCDMLQTHRQENGKRNVHFDCSNDIIIQGWVYMKWFNAFSIVWKIYNWTRYHLYRLSPKWFEFLFICRLSFRNVWSKRVWVLSHIINVKMLTYLWLRLGGRKCKNKELVLTLFFFGLNLNYNEYRIDIPYKLVS